MNMGIWPSKLEKTQNWGNKIWSWVPWDSEPRKIVMARPSSNFKLQTRLLNCLNFHGSERKIGHGSQMAVWYSGIRPPSGTGGLIIGSKITFLFGLWVTSASSLFLEIWQADFKKNPNQRGKRNAKRTPLRLSSRSQYDTSMSEAHRSHHPQIWTTVCLQLLCSWIIKNPSTQHGNLPSYIKRKNYNFQQAPLSCFSCYWQKIQSLDMRLIFYARKNTSKGSSRFSPCPSMKDVPHGTWNSSFSVLGQYLYIWQRNMNAVFLTNWKVA
jgi:hypothetical protein